jgi:hypothetical protein
MSDILTEFEGRMIEIDGADPYVHDLNGQVVRILEVPEVAFEDFTDFPVMFYYTDILDTDYEIGGRFLEKFRVKSITAFNSMLTGAEADDFIADVKLALGDDLKMGGLATFFVVTRAEPMWPVEEKMTIVRIDFSCEFRQLFGNR